MTVSSQAHAKTHLISVPYQQVNGGANGAESTVHEAMAGSIAHG